MTDENDRVEDMAQHIANEQNEIPGTNIHTDAIYPVRDHHRREARRRLGLSAADLEVIGT